MISKNPTPTLDQDLSPSRGALLRSALHSSSRLPSQRTPAYPTTDKGVSRSVVWTEEKENGALENFISEKRQRYESAEDCADNDEAKQLHGELCKSLSAIYCKIMSMSIFPSLEVARRRSKFGIQTVMSMGLEVVAASFNSSVSRSLFLSVGRMVISMGDTIRGTIGSCRISCALLRLDSYSHTPPFS
ncbi:hypothetical protein C1H46_040490 [Malus baccata]|uniref:Uncharacterized protein n=1 Tax=Malus baccata TaxID=106549 RepID=A0A540KIC2_MALBA|nr:hypothetical protein C1H46_040490 [Malus baccata]